MQKQTNGDLAKQKVGEVMALLGDGWDAVAMGHPQHTWVCVFSKTGGGVDRHISATPRELRGLSADVIAQKVQDTFKRMVAHGKK